ncbi:MAG: glyoxalase [Tunicatimonas sp.]
MNQRDEQLLALRPTIPAASVTDSTSDEERFQNETLRPILKMQNPLLLALFRQHIQRRKNVFYQLPEPQRLSYVQQALQKDTTLRDTLKGVVIGHFTEVEWERYAAMSGPLDKRLLQLATQRLQSQLDALNNKLMSSE